MQTQQEKQTQEIPTAEDSFISELRPDLPDNWRTLPTEERQTIVERAQNLLKLRKNLIDLVAGQRKAEGLILQSEADAEEVLERLADPGDLPPHRIKHLNGRLAVYQAEVEKQYELIEQYQRQIDLYKEILSNGEAG
jgi:hypothetical protein